MFRGNGSGPVFAYLAVQPTMKVSAVGGAARVEASDGVDAVEAGDERLELGA